jgi:osmotically inducible protein OsmC
VEVTVAAERRASVTWNGDLMSGSGTIDEVGSGAFGPLDVSWPARAEEASGGKTSPEELIAAAHAACFSMALSHALAQAGTPPERLQTSAAVTFVPGTGITAIALSVRGTVPGMEEDAFREAAQAAKENCPVSKALAGVPDVSLDAALA